MRMFRWTNWMFIVLLVAGCASSNVKRVDVEKPVDYSGRWNDTDSRLVAQEAIQDCLNQSWVEDFRQRTNKRPVVIVGTVANQSHEHISADVFIKDLERSLLKSGKVKFVASRQERGQIREERRDQHDGNTAKETIKAMGRETGADFMLIGSINSIKDELKGRYLILYQVNLELVDLENNEKVWIGQKHIKKVVQRSKFSL